MTRAATICKQPGCPASATNRGYCAAHVSKARTAAPRLSAAAQGYGAQWRALRLRYLKLHPRCEWVGCDAAATDVDHIIPKAQGGPDEWDNLQSLCHAHHSRKTVTRDGGFGRARVTR